MSEPYVISTEIQERGTPLEFLYQLPIHFQGFTLTRVKRIKKGMYLLTLYHGELPPNQVHRRPEMESSLFVGWTREDCLLTLNFRVETGVPKEAFGWLVTEVNLYAEMGVQMISRMHVEPPDYKTNPKNPLFLQFTWTMPCEGPPSSDAVKMFRDVMDWLYQEVRVVMIEINADWHKAGKG
ncbi:MAG: hypothetical protein ACM3TU_02845 [Bacillota bacterium]